jgi:hypothetical protein
VSNVTTTDFGQMGISPHTSRVAIGLAIYASLVVLAFSVNYPGRLTPDSLDMLTQAAHPETLNDWHEPATIGFWLLFAPVLGQPASALLCQALLIFVYPAVLIEQAIAKRISKVLFLLGLAAFVAALIGVTGIIGKDIVLLGLVMCLLAVLELMIVSALSITLPILTVLMIAIISIRPTNSLLFAIAAVFWIVVGRVKIRAAAFILFLIFIAATASFWATKLIDRNVFGARNAKAELQLIIFDVAGISSVIHKDLFAELPGWAENKSSCNSCASGACVKSYSAVCRTGETNDQLESKHRSPWECYSPIQWDPFAWGDCKEYFALVYNINASPISWWVHSIRAHPIAYVIHRSDYTFHLIRSMKPISTWKAPYATNVSFRLDELFGTSTEGIDMRGRFQLWEPRIGHVPFEWTAAFVFSRPILVITIFVCVLALISAWKSNRGAGAEIDLLEMKAAGIGLGNFLMLAAFGVASGGRYLLPTFCCGIVIILRRLACTPGVYGQRRIAGDWSFHCPSWRRR